MNLFFRLLWISLFSKNRSKVHFMERCLTPFRVWPTDLDVLRHMNNGVYFSLQDLARVDFMVRCGAMDILNKNGWYPVVVAETLQFRKSLKPFEKFEIASHIISWDEKYYVLEHQFVRNNEVIAAGYIKARFLKKTGGQVSPSEINRLVGHSEASAKNPEHVSQWLSSVESHQQIWKKN